MKRTMREHWSDPMFRAVTAIFLMWVAVLSITGIAMLIWKPTVEITWLVTKWK